MQVCCHGNQNLTSFRLSDFRIKKLFFRYEMCGVKFYSRTELRKYKPECAVRKHTCFVAFRSVRGSVFTDSHKKNNKLTGDALSINLQITLQKTTLDNKATQETIKQDVRESFQFRSEKNMQQLFLFFTEQYFFFFHYCFTFF